MPINWDVLAVRGPLEVPVFNLVLRRQEQTWIPPKDKFVEYGPEDEYWMREAGYGKMAEAVITITYPSVIVEKMSKDGITFRPVSIPVEERVEI